MRAVDQFVPTFEPGAVGAHAIEIRRALRELGADSEIFAEHVHPDFAVHGHELGAYERFARKRDDACLYHVAIGSIVADFVLDQPRALVVDHHNITPPEYFEVWEPDVVPGIRWGLRQLADLARLADLGIADSAFNAGELEQLGCVDTRVVPILLDVAQLDLEPDVDTQRRLEADRELGGADILFVGRVAPHKAQHDLVRALALYRRAFDPRARLRIVGGAASSAYSKALDRLVADLDLVDAVEISGPVTRGQLAAYYRNATVYLSASEHEGFCVPLLEAWHHDLPVVAYRAGAIGETMGGAGILLDRKEPLRMAAAIDRVARDAVLRASLAAAGRGRLARFALARTRSDLESALAPVLAGSIER